MADLYGDHDYAVDPKGRVSLPRDWVGELEEGLVFTLGIDRCLDVYPRGDWDRRADRVKRLDVALPDNREFRRVFFGNAQPATLGEQGRLVIPRKLREKVGLGRRVTIAGNGDHLEVWPADVFHARERHAEERYVSGATIPEDLKGGVA